MPVFPSTLVPQLVGFVQLDTTPCVVNASWVSGLTPVPAALLPALVPAGTYIDLSGDAPTRVAVVGDLATVSAALIAGNAAGWSRELTWSGSIEGAVGLVSGMLSNAALDVGTSIGFPGGTAGWINPLDIDSVCDRFFLNILVNTLDGASTLQVVIDGNVQASIAIPHLATGIISDLTSLVQWGPGQALALVLKNNDGTAGNFLALSVTHRVRN